MLNGLHVIWSRIEKDPRFQQMKPLEQAAGLDHFVNEFKTQYGETAVAGLHGFHKTVRHRLLNPEAKRSFGEQVAQAFNEQAENQYATGTGGMSKEQLDALYELSVESGEFLQDRDVLPELVGQLGHTAANAAVPAGVGFAVGGPPGAVAGAATAGAAVSEGVAEFGRSQALNYFAAVEGGMPEEQAYNRATGTSVVSAGLVGAANALPTGKILTSAGTKLAGRGAVGRAVGKAFQAGDTFTGPARAGVEALKGGVDDVVLETANVGVERAAGIDASGFKGTLAQRAGIAGAGGVALRGALTAVGKTAKGVRNVQEGKPFTENIFSEENYRGFLGSVERGIQDADAQIRRLEGEGLDTSARRQEIEVTRQAADELRSVWDTITDGTQPLDLRVLAEQGPDGADASFVGRTLSAYTGMFEWDGNAAKRINLLHEGAHAHFDTLPVEYQARLRDLFDAEVKQQAGPLFDADGNLRKNLSNDLESPDPEVALREWYAERTALKNDDWAKGKVEQATSVPETLIGRLAQDFRNKAQAVGRQLGFTDGLDASFRDFLDAGKKYEFDGSRPGDVALPPEQEAEFQVVADRLTPIEQQRPAVQANPQVVQRSRVAANQPAQTPVARPQRVGEAPPIRQEAVPVRQQQPAVQPPEAPKRPIELPEASDDVLRQLNERIKAADEALEPIRELARSYGQDPQFARRQGGGAKKINPLNEEQAQTLTRKFADRARKTDPVLEEIATERPDIASKGRDRQSVNAIVKDAEAKGEDVLINSRETLKNGIDVGEGEANTAVIDTLELMRRFQEAGNREEVEATFEVLAKRGTTIGQMLRQYREFKGVAARKHRLELLEMELNRSGRSMDDALKTKIQKFIDDDAAAHDKVDSIIEQVNKLAEEGKEIPDSLIKAGHKADIDQSLAAKKLAREIKSILPRFNSQIFTDLTTMVQGGILTPLSVGRNFFGNYISVLPRAAARSFAAPFDAARAKLTGGERTLAGVGLRELGWGLRGTGRGLVKGIHAFRYGVEENIIAGEQLRGFNPIKAFVQAFGGKSQLPVNALTGKIALKDRAAKLFEGLFGTTPEVMFRLLALADEMAKEGFRSARAAEEIKLRKTKPGSKEFADIALRTTDDAKLVTDEAALAGTYQNAGKAAEMFQRLENAIADTPAIGPALRFGFRVMTSPFIRTPVNLFVEGMKFAIPEWGFAYAAAKSYQAYFGDLTPAARKKAIRDAEIATAYAVTGMIFAKTAVEFAVRGITSGGPDDDRKVNLVRGETGMGYFRINLSAVRRYMDGENTDHQPGDRTVRLDSLGVMGYVFGIKAEAERLKEINPTAVPEPTSEYATQMLGSFLAGGRFAVNQTMLQGVQELFTYFDRGDPSGLVKDKVNLLTAAVPGGANSILAARTVYDEHDKDHPFRPQLRVPNDPQATLQNIITYKFGDRDQLLEDRDIFGVARPLTPDRANPDVYHLVDSFQVREIGDKAVDRLFRLYEQTQDARVIPSSQSRTITWRGQRMTLKPEQYDELYAQVQGAKGLAFQRMTQYPGWQRLVDTNPAVAVKQLSASYERAGNAARKQWMFRNAQSLNQLRDDLQKLQIPSRQR